MKKIRSLSSLCAVLIAVAFALTACDKTEPAKSAAAEGASDKHKDEDRAKEGVVKITPEEMKTAGIELAAIAERTVNEQILLTAIIRANQDRIAHVAPRVSGRVTKVSANLGDAVKAGQTLALIDSIELGEAHSAFLQATSQHAVARADFERAERLRKDEIIPEKDYLRARYEFEKARAALQAATDKLRLLGVAPSAASPGAAVSVYPLTSPVAGTIIEKHAVLGELAKPDTPLFTTADLSTVWIEANLFEKDLAKVKPGAPATVTVTAYPGDVFKGRLTYISSTVDKETRAVPARIEVPNPDGRLKPEMFATAAIETGDVLKGLFVPQEAVLLVQGQPTVFVESAGGFEPRPIAPGPSSGNRVQVKAGLKPGERVAVAGGYALKARLLKSQLGEGHTH